MKGKIVDLLRAFTGLNNSELESIIEIPKDSLNGDYACPCFSLAKKFKKSPVEIAKEIALRLQGAKGFEKIEAVGSYVNFFVDKRELAKNLVKKILKEKDKFGKNSEGKNRSVVVELSSPNIAKPFGIGHLRSTIIGNSISNIAQSIGYRVKRINYLGDWGTQFGKLIVGYKKFNGEGKLKEGMRGMLELYVEANKEEFEDEAREWFRKLEEGDKEAVKLWKLFREKSLKEFNEIYDLLEVKFDEISGESLYSEEMKEVIKDLEKKKLLEESDGAKIVNLEKYNLGVSLIQKSDGATLYATRDLAAAIDRYKRYKFHKMIYEVGGEQKLHFNQLFKILEMMDYSWAKNCIHADHGLYLDSDGKKFSTRKGKTVFMKEVFDETIELAKSEISKREKLSEKELNSRAVKIARAAILYGDLKNYRSNNMVFDIDRFLAFEGDTGPYLLYSYARAKSVLKKGKYRRGIGFIVNQQSSSAGLQMANQTENRKTKLVDYKIDKLEDSEKALIFEMSRFPEVVKHAYDNLAPNIIANYAYSLAQKFSEFYHACKVLGSEEEKFRLVLVDCFSQIEKNALRLLGIDVIERM